MSLLKTFIVMADTYSEGYGCYIPEIMGVYINTDINHVLKSFPMDDEGDSYYIKVVGEVGTPLLNARDVNNSPNKFFDYDIEGLSGGKDQVIATLRSKFGLNCLIDEISGNRVRIYPNIEYIHPLVKSGKLTQQEYDQLVSEIINQG